MYVYNKIDKAKWTVGHFTPTGTWINESYHQSALSAAERVARLNGNPIICPYCERIRAAIMKMLEE